jgi:hypothetical protein
VSETTRELTWQERQRSQQALRQLAEELKRPPQSSAIEAARDAAASRVAASSLSTAATSARRIGEAQDMARVRTSAASRRALKAAINPSITRLARGGLASVHVGGLIGAQRTLFPRFASDIGRVSAFSQIDSVTKIATEAIGGAALSKAVQGVGASLATDFFKGIGSHQLLLTELPSVHLFVGSAGRPAFEQVHDILNTWSRGFPFDSFGRSLARIPLFAALRVRRAALRGDLAAVREFIVNWLERQPTEPMVEATIDALLEDDWVPYDDDDAVDLEVIEHLQRLAGRYTRRHKMIGQTQIVGRSVDSLDRLVPVGRSGERVSLVTLTADPSTAIIDVDVDSLERRAQRALGQFKPEEQQVLLAWEPGMTWQEAAAAAGLTPEVAERVRRKRKRVAQEAARRTDALRMTAARAG